ncbi:cytochrome o ubiquinol oxidase subunit IV [Sphingomonas sp. MA1305]|uniref:cytochrome o ubiquinol oxidase subunit IV n=1 Tax=unclassified Sphingomonas TaxID=196159 RepID=UPI0018DF9F12|nr:cytochrome o ubiquinol oxidase subunit IV [Sphingomonas sp. MA1305]MBI0476505.1 cytochrome o ubiquinol oxidase subunit IV [Sphingomonas sp. MA1305]
MSDDNAELDDDRAPGDGASAGASVGEKVRTYAAGFVLAALLTGASFTVAGTGLVWGPAIPVALIALAIAQMGVHLVFFLHVTSGPDNTNNVLALAFGVLIVGLVLVGSIWIMGHLDHNLMPGMVRQPAM